MQHSDCILIMGSNMAECHPVGFQWVMEAKERGANVIHVDPRFTRTSAMADLYVPIRSGSDVAFLGGLVRYILENGREFTEYVRHYTNASAIIAEEFRDTEDLDGFFSGFDPETGLYNPTSWGYQDAGGELTAGKTEASADVSGEQAHGAHGMTLPGGRPPHVDPDMQHPRCVLQLLRKHFARYTPEMVQEICGVPREQFLAVAEALCANSGRERTGAIAYAVGWTQPHGRRADHPRRRDRAAAARQHRAPRRRDPGPARPREHPGLDRHPDALQHPPELHPDAPPAGARDARGVRRQEQPAAGRVGRPAARTRRVC